MTGNDSCCAEKTALGVGSRGKYSTWLLLVLYLPLDLTPHTRGTFGGH